MKKVGMWILSITMIIFSLLGILLFAGLWYSANYSPYAGELSTFAYVVMGICIVASPLLMVGAIKIIHNLKHPEEKQNRQALKDYENQRKKLKQEQEMESFYEKERQRRDEKYRLYSELKAREEEKKHQKELEYQEKQKELADDDIREITGVKGKGLAFYFMIICYVFSGAFLFGTVAVIGSGADIMKGIKGSGAIAFSILWYMILILPFIVAAEFKRIYKARTMQVFVKTEKTRLYYCRIIPRYDTPTTYFSKVNKIEEKNRVALANKKIYQEACEYMNSEEFKSYLADRVHRKEAVTAERVEFTYLQEYKCRRGMLHDYYYYKDEVSNGKSKIKVYK